MTNEDIVRITTDINEITEVIKNKLRSCEDIIQAGVKCTNAIADLEQACDLVRSAICTRPENVDIAAARVKVIWKNETIAERRLLTIAKGFKNTLKNLEYRDMK